MAVRRARLTGLLALLLSLPAAAFSDAIDIHELQQQWLRAPAEFRVEGGPVALEEVRERSFQPLDDAAVNRGISDRRYWIRFRLSNQDGEQARRWVLAHETSYIDDMVVYVAEEDGQFRRLAQLTDHRPFASRPVSYRTLAVAHETAAGGYSDIYVELGHRQPNAVSLNLRLVDADHFLTVVQREYLAQGIYVGIMLVLILLALACALILRQWVYLSYAGFLLTSTLMWMLLPGYAAQYLWPGNAYLHNEGSHALYLLMGILALQFSRQFLSTSERLPRCDAVLRAGQWLMALGIALRLLGLYEPVLMLSYGAVAYLLMLPLLGYYAWWHGQRYAFWYAVAWTLYSLTLTASVVSAGTGLLSWGMGPLPYAQLGSALEAVLLMVALGERLRLWEHDRRRALLLAQQDPLTGLANRRVVGDAWEQLCALHEKTGRSVYLLMIDLDRFKALNDTWGHQAGDRVLRRLGRVLLSSSRPEDVCIRYGGEEFVVLAPTPTPEAARQFAERIRQEFERRPTHHRGVDISHTLSIGVAEALSAEHQRTLDEALGEADVALYRAKAQGGNTVVMAGEAVPGEQGLGIRCASG